mmetsp:Transcript_69940/g.166996  ORF Transcript_69940/g.166996 Transcript_69940/m.166996 type:complete len:232 (-) Transcript_69940:696-1391(-)
MCLQPRHRLLWVPFPSAVLGGHVYGLQLVPLPPREGAALRKSDGRSRRLRALHRGLPQQLPLLHPPHLRRRGGLWGEFAPPSFALRDRLGRGQGGCRSSGRLCGHSLCRRRAGPYGRSGADELCLARSCQPVGQVPRLLGLRDLLRVAHVSLPLCDQRLRSAGRHPVRYLGDGLCRPLAALRFGLRRGGLRRAAHRPAPRGPAHDGEGAGAKDLRDPGGRFALPADELLWV